MFVYFTIIKNKGLSNSSSIGKRLPRRPPPKLPLNVRPALVWVCSFCEARFSETHLEITLPGCNYQPGSLKSKVLSTILPSIIPQIATSPQSRLGWYIRFPFQRFFCLSHGLEFITIQSLTYNLSERIATRKEGWEVEFSGIVKAPKEWGRGEGPREKIDLGRNPRRRARKTKKQCVSSPQQGARSHIISYGPPE